MTTPILVGPLLQVFFTEYLVAQKRLSPQTIASYRDTFRLLLQFVHRETHRTGGVAHGDPGCGPRPRLP